MHDKRYSVQFSEFRNLMDVWDNYVFVETVHNELEKFLTHKEIIMYFLYPVKHGKPQKKARLYGATEEGRLAFAKIKNPNDDDPEKAQDNFQAFDLESLINHSDEPEEIQRIKIFNRKDIKKIKIVSQDYAIDKLTKLRTASHLKPIDDPESEKEQLDDE